jgi:hypothetical protein
MGTCIRRSTSRTSAGSSTRSTGLSMRSMRRDSVTVLPVSGSPGGEGELGQDDRLALGDLAPGHQGAHGPDPRGPAHQVSSGQETQKGEGADPAQEGSLPGEVPAQEAGAGHGRGRGRGRRGPSLLDHRRGDDDGKPDDEEDEGELGDPVGKPKHPGEGVYDLEHHPGAHHVHPQHLPEGAAVGLDDELLQAGDHGVSLASTEPASAPIRSRARSTTGWSSGSASAQSSTSRR